MMLGALGLALWLPSGMSQLAEVSPSGILAEIYPVFVSNLITYGTRTVALSLLPASRASNFMYWVPPVAALLSAFGGAMALVGVAAVNWQQ